MGGRRPRLATGPTARAALELLARAVELGVGVVQFADNLPLERRDEPELSALEAFAREHGSRSSWVPGASGDSCCESPTSRSAWVRPSSAS